MNTSVSITVSAALTLTPPISPALTTALRETFTLANPLYTEAVEHGRSTRDLPPRLFYYEALPDGSLCLPRGAIEAVYALCVRHGATVAWRDHTHVEPPITLTEGITLSPAQEDALQQVLTRKVGVLEAPAGSGKTIMGLAAIARRGQPALWITHTRELAAQAIARAGMVLGLDAAEIGFIGDGRCSVGERLTVALVQSLARGIPADLLDVGHVVIDECHHAPAEQMAGVISQFPARYLLGLTATPFRRDGLDAVIGYYLGPTVARMDRASLADRLIRPRVFKRDTGIRPDGASFVDLVSALVRDPERNALLVADVCSAVRKGRRCLVLSDRVDHVETLTRALRAAGVPAEALHGQMPKAQRARVVSALNGGTLPVAVATMQLVGEGFDCPRLDVLLLATPVSFAGRVEQYLGRVSRTAPGKRDALVLDYCDDHRMLWASWRKRAVVYRQLATVERAGERRSVA